MAKDEHRTEVLRALRQLCGKAVQSIHPQSASRRSFGIPALDTLLPGGGVECGSLVEWLVPADGSGAAILALQGIQSALDGRLVWAVIDEQGEFHPSAVRGWGISLESLLLLRPSSEADAFWAVEQCLRCPAVGVTWFFCEQIPDRVVQRWKRAAEIGGGIGVLFRSAMAKQRSSWADIRWHVQPQPGVSREGRVIRVELLFCRGCFAGGSVDLELRDATGDVCVVSTVANSTITNRAARA